MEKVIYAYVKIIQVGQKHIQYEVNPNPQPPSHNHPLPLVS